LQVLAWILKIDWLFCLIGQLFDNPIGLLKILLQFGGEVKQSLILFFQPFVLQFEFLLANPSPHQLLNVF